MLRKWCGSFLVSSQLGNNSGYMEFMALSHLRDT